MRLNLVRMRHQRGGRDALARHVGFVVEFARIAVIARRADSGPHAQPLANSIWFRFENGQTESAAGHSGVDAFDPGAFHAQVQPGHVAHALGFSVESALQDDPAIIGKRPDAGGAGRRVIEQLRRGRGGDRGCAERDCDPQSRLGQEKRGQRGNTKHCGKPQRDAQAHTARGISGQYREGHNVQGRNLRERGPRHPHHWRALCVACRTCYGGSAVHFPPWNMWRAARVRNFFAALPRPAALLAGC